MIVCCAALALICDNSPSAPTNQGAHPVRFGRDFPTMKPPDFSPGGNLRLWDRPPDRRRRLKRELIELIGITGDLVAKGLEQLQFLGREAG